MKKKIILISSIAILAILICGLVICNVVSKNKYKKLTETIGVKSAEKIKYEIPKFSLTIGGIYDNTITNVDCANLDVYKFKAVMDDGIYKRVYEYVGIKVEDVLEMANMDNYNKITFMSSGFLQVTYSKDEITDNTYFVFEVDGKTYEYPDSIALVNPELNARYSITGLARLNFD